MSVLAGPVILAINAATGPAEAVQLSGAVERSRRHQGFRYTFDVRTTSGLITVEVTEAEKDRHEAASKSWVTLNRRRGGLGLYYLFRWDDELSGLR